MKLLFVLLFLIVTCNNILLKKNEYNIIHDVSNHLTYQINVSINMVNPDINKKLSCYVMDDNDIYIYKKNDFSKIDKDKFRGIIVFENWGFDFFQTYSPIMISKNKFIVFKNNGSLPVEFNMKIKIDKWKYEQVATNIIIVAIVCVFIIIALIIIILLIFILILCYRVCNNIIKSRKSTYEKIIDNPFE